MAAVSAEGSTVCVLIRRLNSSCSRSLAFVVRADFHWLEGSRVKANSASPASSRLSATARHFSRHLRRKAFRRASICFALAAWIRSVWSAEISSCSRSGARARRFLCL